MKNFTSSLFVSLALLFFPISSEAVTINSQFGETVDFTLSNVTDGEINCSEPIEDPMSSTTVYCTAPIYEGAPLKVDVDITNLVDLTDNSLPVASQRRFTISIPDDGIRWIARKTWLASSGIPQPTEPFSLAHKAKVRPYQAEPAYDVRYQVDKWIEIEDVFFTYDDNVRRIAIYIIPTRLIGLANSEDNGLPVHAKTDPDYEMKDPYGCNGCSEMGLPGYRVNMTNLKPTIQDTLFTWQGLGPDVALQLTWNSGVTEGYTDFGSGWRFSYDLWLQESSEGVTVSTDSGGQTSFNIPEGGNQNVTNIVVDNDTEIYLEYDAEVGTPNYTTEWDGKYDKDEAGYHLEKDLAATGIRRFRMSTPTYALTYIFEGGLDPALPIPLVAVEDRNGNRLEITRNGNGAITAITDAAGRSSTLQYNGSGRCSKVTVPGGGEMDFSYIGDTLISTVDLLGTETLYSYDANDNVTHMNTEGRIWSFSWAQTDGVFHLDSTTDPEGAITSYAITDQTFDLKQTAITAPDGQLITYKYPEGRYKTNSREQRPTVYYGDNGKPSEVKSVSGTSKYLEYDANGLITKITDYNTGEHQYTYNQFGQVLTYADAFGELWQFDYDANGNLTKGTSPEGRVKLLEYDSSGQLVKMTDPSGNITQLSYDAFGNLAAFTLANGGVYTYGYDINGINLTQVTDPYGNTTSFTYDANRRLKKTIHPDGSFTENIYDSFAAIGKRNENGNTASVTRSPSLLPLTVTDYMGNVTTLEYTSGGKLKSITDAAGNVQRYTYNQMGQPLENINPLGQRIKWNYWDNDRIRSMILSQNPLVEIEVSSNEYGLYSANGYQYVQDLMGRPLRVITPADYWRRINMARDADGYMTGKDIDGSPIASFSWNPNGTMASTTHTLGTDSYSYNGLGQVLTQSWYSGTTSSFSYDLKGQQTQVTYPDGYAADYTYNARGFITNILWRGVSFQFVHDAAGSVIEVQRSNGIDTTYTLDRNDKLLGVSHKKGREDLLSLNCQRDARGMLQQCSKSSDILSLKPVFASRIDSGEYTYERSFTLTRFNGETATTDLNGNQTAIPGERNFSGTYDLQNLLTSWSANGIDSSAVYDGDRRLIRFTHNGVQRNFHYDIADRLLFETDSSGNVVRQWLYHRNEVIAMYYQNGIYFYHVDQRSNIAFLTDSEGNVAAEYSYLPYGMQVGIPDTTDNPFTFSGRYGVLDLGDGLYYMRLRTYDAVTRAFLSNDPTGVGVTLNARSYANSNPMNFIDPDGRSAISDFGGYANRGPIYPGADGASGYKGGNPNRQKSLRQMRGLGPRKDSKGCLIDWDFLANITQNTGPGGIFGKISIFDKLQKGNYGDAAWDMIKNVAGVGVTFWEGQPPPPETEEERLSKFDTLWDGTPINDQADAPAVDPQGETEPEYTFDE